MSRQDDRGRPETEPSFHDGQTQSHLPDSAPSIAVGLDSQALQRKFFADLLNADPHLHLPASAKESAVMRFQAALDRNEFLNAVDAWVASGGIEVQFVKQKVEHLRQKQDELSKAPAHDTEGARRALQELSNRVGIELQRLAQSRGVPLEQFGKVFSDEVERAFNRDPREELRREVRRAQEGAYSAPVFALYDRQGELTTAGKALLKSCEAEVRALMPRTDEGIAQALQFEMIPGPKEQMSYRQITDFDRVEVAKGIAQQAIFYALQKAARRVGSEPERIKSGNEVEQSLRGLGVGTFVVIGRGDGADMKVSQLCRQVSTMHLGIERTAEGWLLYDKASTNGTIVNGGLILSGEPLLVNCGDKVQIGELEFTLP